MNKSVLSSTLNTLLVLAALLCTGCTDPLIAARAQLAASGELRTAVLFANPLLGSMDAATGQPAGLTADFGAVYAARLGVPVRLLGYSLTELVRSARENAWDLTLLMGDSLDDEVMEPAGQLATVPVTGLVPAGSSIRDVSELDRPGLRLVVVAKGAGEAAVIAKGLSAGLVQAGSLKRGVQLLREGRADVLIHASQQLVPLAATSGLRLLEGRLADLPIMAAVPRGRSSGRSYTERFIAEWRTTQQFRQLLQRSGLDDGQ